MAVIDLDVHQGNGTASIFPDDPTVFTLSLHGAHNFPFRKEASDLDVDAARRLRRRGLPGGARRRAGQLWARHADAPPGLVFYLAGADPHDDDRLGPPLAQRRRARRARPARLRRARERGVAVAISMAGGYGRVVEQTVAIQLATLAAACDSWRQWQTMEATCT